MKKLRVFLTIVLTLCFIFTAGCGNVLVPVKTNVPEFTASPTKVPTDALEPSLTSTPTKVPTETPEPSPTLIPTQVPTETPVITPTPTEPPVEWDLDPFIEKSIDYVWEGIRIKARVLVDRSLESRIKSIDIPDETLAGIVAKNLFVVWYARNHPDESWLKKDYKVRRADIPIDEMYSFKKLWAKAQETGAEEDWREVQIDNVWVNDLNDGNGYVQKPRSFWPMYEGVTPEGVIAMKVFTIAIVRTSSMVNMYSSNTTTNNYLWDFGFGVNIFDGNLIYYSGESYNPVTCELSGDWVAPECLNFYLRMEFASVGIQIARHFGDYPNYIFIPYEPITSQTWYIKAEFITE